jgi:O-antigen/teichoic acid export membrane protein
MRGSRKTSPFRGRSAVRSGLLTGLSIVAVSGSAAVAGVILAQKFGRDLETDGILAAYGIYLVLVLAAQAFRLVVVPDLTRAAGEGRLGAETRAYGLVFLAFAMPVIAFVALLAGPLGDALPGGLPDESADLAGRALVWFVPAAFLQLFAALAASALAARDSYGVAAVGYAAGAVLGVALFLALADEHGLISLAWGVALNGAIAFVVPAVALVVDGDLRGSGAGGPALVARLSKLVHGSAVPLALQGLYLIGLRAAADLGIGSVTSFSYAYLLAATLVAATASSLSLISAAPLTRRGLDAQAAAEHVVHSSWLSLALIAAAAGVFALVGERVVSLLLGDAYSGEVGRELGRLVLYLVPWMIATVAFSVTYPLLFVMERRHRLELLAVAAVLVHVPVTIALREAFGLAGIAFALALTTCAVIAVLMVTVSPRMLAVSALGVGRLAIRLAFVVGLSFGVLALLVGGVAAAAVGLALYALLLAAIRPRGLREAWAYVRALH